MKFARSNEIEEESNLRRKLKAEKIFLSHLVEKIQETSLRSAPERLVSERIYKRLIAAEKVLSLSGGGEDFFGQC